MTNQMKRELLELVADVARDVAKRYDGDSQDAFRTFAALLSRMAAELDRRTHVYTDGFWPIPSNVPVVGVADVHADPGRGTTFCDNCHRPMTSHRMMGATPICPDAAEWSTELPRWHP